MALSSYQLLKPFLYCADPEFMHDQILDLMRRFPWLVSDQRKTKVFSKLQVKVFNLNFNSPLGLAAGFDKNAIALNALERCGFGSVEIGTITPKMQSGNSKPRIFRYPKINSLRNSMGFPNLGSKYAAEQLKQFNGQMIVGANLGKNKSTPNDQAAKDYCYLYHALAPWADYLVINVSSPNTPGLRKLLDYHLMKEILQELIKTRTQCKKPLLIKISPDMTRSEIEKVYALAADYQIDGIVACNTSIQHKLGMGGVSGLMIKKIAWDCHTICLEFSRSFKMETICCGGISQWSDYQRLLAQGARLIQIYTSFVFQGPALINKIHHDILWELKKRNLSNLEDLRLELMDEIRL